MDLQHWLDCVEQHVQLLQLGVLVVAALFAFLQIHSQRAISRRQVTFNTIREREVQSAHWLTIATKAKSVLADEAAWRKLIEEREEDQELLFTVISYLNYFELIAVGIKNRTLDKRLYQAWARSRYIANWNCAKPFVEEWRKVDKPKHEKSFTEFQDLVEKWEETPSGSPTGSG